MRNSPELEQLRRDKMIAKATADLIKMHDGMNSSVEEVRRMVAQYLAAAERIQRLPKGDKGDRGERGFIGPEGRPGKDGKDGKDGFAPVKGKDYLTKGDEDLLVLRVLSRIKTPKDGETPVVDYDKIIEEAVEKLKGDKKLGWRDIDGLENELSSYRNQLARKQAGQHGGGDTVVAGSNITITALANGTKEISSTASGTGDVVGPASATDNAVARFNLTTGKLIQNSGVTISDTDVVLVPSLTASEIVITDASKNLVSAAVATYPSLTELTYLKGVTSAIQTQLNAKGDVTGPASSTDNAIARFDGTTGKLIQNSAATIADTSGNITAGTYNGNTIGAGSTSGTNTGDQTTISGNAGTATALQTARTIGTITGDATSAGSSFDGTANNTNALTLATVNSNVGSFTNASITVNAKGLITAASSGAAPEVPLTFSTGLTRTSNTITANISTGIAGSQTIYGGTAANEDLTIEGTSNATKTTSYVILQPTAGNVGIGTATPNYKLDVNGAAIFNNLGTLSEPTSESGFGLKFRDFGGTANDIGIGVGGSVGDENLWINSLPSSTGAIRFMFGTSGEKARITSAGNVGIGNTAPDTALVIGTASSTGNYVKVLGSAADSTYLVFSGQRQYPKFELVDTFAGGSTFNFWNLGNTMRFGTDTGVVDTAALAVLSGPRGEVRFGGNVGFNVYGDSALTIPRNISVIPNRPYAGYPIDVGTFTLQGIGALALSTDKDGGDLYLNSGISTGTGDSNIYIGTATAGSTGTSDNAPTTKVTILGNGNVGIGASTISALLSLGEAGTKAGTLSLAGGTSGVITLQTAAAAGTYTLTLPTTDGAANEFLQTDGSGVLTWAVPAGTGANTALSNLAAVAINTALLPGANNTIALGAAATAEWSDLFLGEGAVINFDNGDLTLTQSGNSLTLAGGEFNFGANTAYFTETDNGNSSTADTIDWKLSNKQKSTLTDNCTFTFTAPSGPCNLLLKLVQDATGSRTVTWPAAVKWPGGVAPTLTTTANRIDIVTFYYDGTNYYGNSSLNFTP